MITLPTEVLALISTLVRRHPQQEVETLVSEVVSTLAGQTPNLLLPLVRSSGSLDVVITAIAEAVERAKADCSQTARG